MCLIYRCKHKTPFIRLCARTGQRGVHIELTPEQAANWRGGCWNTVRTDAGPRFRQKLHSIRFTGVFYEDVVKDMERRYHATAYLLKDGSMVFNSIEGMSISIIERARTFGWSVYDRSSN